MWLHEAALPRTCLWLSQGIDNPAVSVFASVTALGTAQPREMGASYSSPLCSCVAGSFIACLLRSAVRVAVLTWHTRMLQTCLCLELAGHRGLWHGEMRSAFFSQKPGESACAPSAVLIPESLQGIYLHPGCMGCDGLGVNKECPGPIWGQHVRLGCRKLG